MDWSKEAAKIAPEIRQGIKSCDGLHGPDKAAKQRTVAAGIVASLLSVGLAYMERVPPEHTAMHPENRSGLGCIAAEVHVLLFLILSQGFIWAEVAGKCWAFQKNPNPKIGKKNQK